MTYREFKDSVLVEIDKAESERTQNTLGFHFKVGRDPYVTNVDTNTFMTNEIWDVWNFVKDRPEWFVDVYEDIKDDDGFGHAEYTGCSVLGGKKDLLDRINDCNIFAVRKENGVQYVHMLGYYYDAECSMEDDGRNWRYVMFGGLDFTLDELRTMSEDDIYDAECECKQWIDDLNEDEVVECFLEDVPVELHYSDVTEDTPEGVYIAI